MSTLPIAAVVFDMDGVLTDTETIWDEVRRGLAEQDGVAWPEGATQAMMGMSTPEWSAYLTTTVGVRGDPGERTLEAMAARYRKHLPILPGAVEAVQRLAARWPLALASSSARRLIDTSLETLGITDLFQVSVSTEEVARGKPAPDGFLRACELLGVEPARAVALEDSSNGLRSASAAGMRVIAVPHKAFPPADDALALADVVVGSLDEVTVDLVAGLGSSDVSRPPR
ncbi:HAD family hydrolase [Ornithinimicrobium cryptoxanthini]|uniref:HAD family phosphatase n=1 Tax=Ornithinimicrobium cryptoxanthini TaxID=2934161 RepID=A0ABY4YGN6_9MICO|nr:HAD family phosphatase [Ornithinimicrobium cryptoxanthini]USQ75908.1 HAD family phosphatase [Ornithinimicrobium cryptoxanthini]